MNTKVNKRLLVVWLVLSTLTFSYLWLDHSADHAGIYTPSTVVTVSAIAIALVKVRVIFREFMEVRNAPALLCRLTDTWVLLIAAALLGSYFLGMAIR